MKSKKEKYIAFLRGINVGGHHKVPMLELRQEMSSLNFEKIETILNTGNILFDGPEGDLEVFEKIISIHLEQIFGFPIPTILKTADSILKLISPDPFKNIRLTKDIRLYVSFLKIDKEIDLIIPWENDDKSYQILSKKYKTIFSVLDLSVSGTPEGMEALEKCFGKNITTRNWNTIKRIEKKLNS